MGGVMAGSAALKRKTGATRENKLTIVTLTINNICQLRCPHCYLNYDGTRSTSLPMIFEMLEHSTFSHLAIVGKEPLANERAVADCEALIRLCREKAATVSLITNGIGLDRLTPEMLAHLSFVDVSMDGGPLTYAQFRHADFNALMTKIKDAKKKGLRELNLLHTLFEENAPHVGDMLDVRQHSPVDSILFSPYLETQNDGTNTVTMLPPDRYLASFHSVRDTLDDQDYICFNQYYLSLFQTNNGTIKKQAQQAGLDHHVVVLECNPLELGMIRVTYDGKILSPYASVHPALYRHSRLTVPSVAERGWTLNQAFEEIRRCELAPTLA